MTEITYASGSQTAVIGTEHFLSSPNANGVFQLALDLSNMAAGDILEVRAYKMAVAGGTSRAMWFQAFYGAQPSWALITLSAPIPNSLTDTNAVRFSIKQTFGTGRVYAWNVIQENDQANTQITGTASAGGSNTVTLAGGSSVDNLYKYSLVQIVTGTGAGQVRLIIDYNGTTKVATISKAWATTPDSTSTFAVIPFATPEIAQSGLAQAGAANTITLSATASANDNTYVGQAVVIMGGTGVGQSRIIQSYVGSTKVATLDQVWATNPDNTSVYLVMSFGRSWADVFMQNGLGQMP